MIVQKNCLHIFHEFTNLTIAIHNKIEASSRVDIEEKQKIEKLKF